MVVSKRINGTDGKPVIHTDGMIVMYRQHFASIGCNWASSVSDNSIVKNFEHRYGSIFQKVREEFKVSVGKSLQELGEAFTAASKEVEKMSIAIERANRDI